MKLKMIDIAYFDTQETYYSIGRFTVSEDGSVDLPPSYKNSLEEQFAQGGAKYLHHETSAVSVDYQVGISPKYRITRLETSLPEYERRHIFTNKKSAYGS